MKFVLPSVAVSLIATEKEIEKDLKIQLNFSDKLTT